VLIFSSWVFSAICPMFTSFVCVRCVVCGMSENALQLCCHTAAVGSGLNESIYVLFCVVVAVVVVVVVECEILLSLVTAPRKT